MTDGSTTAVVRGSFRDLAAAAVSAARADVRVCGLIVNGSVASGTDDDWSDLDLVIVSTDDDQFTAGEGRAFAKQLGPLLVAFTGEHVGEPRLLIALYGPPPQHVDLKFVRLSDLGSRVEDGLVLWHRDDALSGVLGRTTATWPTPDPQWVEDRFWVWVHYIGTKIGRGELLEAADALTMVRGLALGPLASAGRTTKPAGVRRIETLAPEHADALRQTVARADVADCLRALDATIGLYRRLRDLGQSTPPVVARTEAEAAVVSFLADITRRSSGTSVPAVP